MAFGVSFVLSSAFLVNGTSRKVSLYDESDESLNKSLCCPYSVSSSEPLNSRSERSSYLLNFLRHLSSLYLADVDLILIYCNNSMTHLNVVPFLRISLGFCCCRLRFFAPSFLRLGGHAASMISFVGSDCGRRLGDLESYVADRPSCVQRRPGITELEPLGLVSGGRDVEVSSWK